MKKGNNKNRAKISSIVLTHNNTRTIRKCVNSIKDISDEIIIIDDNSTDKTIEIIKTIYPKVKIFKRSLNRDFARQRNFGLEKAKNSWVLMIDSDEALSPRLKNSIAEELEKENPNYEAYRCKIKNYSFDKGSLNDLVRPILFKSNLRFKGSLHEQIENTSFGNLKGYIDHFSWIDAEDWIQDLNTYSTNQAKRWIEERNWNKFALLIIGLLLPPFIFLKMFFWEGRWRRGPFAGLLYCIACSVEHLFSVLKYYEIKYVKK